MASAKRDLTNTAVQGKPRPSHANDELMSLQQVADLLEVSINTIYYWRYKTPPAGRQGRQACALLVERCDQLAEDASQLKSDESIQTATFD